MAIYLQQSDALPAMTDPEGDSFNYNHIISNGKTYLYLAGDHTSPYVYIPDLSDSSIVT